MKLLQSLLYNKKLVNRHKEFLKKGKYILMPNLRTYCFYKDIDKYSSFPQDGLNKNGFKYFILRILFSFNVKNECNSNIKSGVVYFTNCPNVYNRDIKLFDYTNLKVMIICQNSTRYELHERIINQNGLFPSTKTLLKDNKNLYFIEELFVKSEDSEHRMDYERNSFIVKLIDFYCDYYVNAKKTSVVENGIPFILQHGDLSIDNIAINEDDFIFLDFDFINNYPLLYDLWFLATNYSFCFNYNGFIDSIIEHKKLKYIIQEVFRLDLFELSFFCFSYMKLKRIDNILNVSDIEKYNTVFDYCLNKIKNGGK